jgi:Flp pilus assembly protein protease CpaA
MDAAQVINDIIPAIALSVAATSDVRTAKVSNRLCGAILLATVLFHLSRSGLSDLPNLFLAPGLAVLLMLPLVLARVLGAGDMKAFAAVAPAMMLPAVFWTFFLALVWGTVLGVIIAVTKGRGAALAANTFRLLTRDKPAPESLHRLPYTVALLFGWLTVVTLQAVGRL